MTKKRALEDKYDRRKFAARSLEEVDGTLHNTVVTRIRPISPTRRTVTTRPRRAKIAQATPRELGSKRGRRARGTGIPALLIRYRRRAAMT